jgi:hypothetical protein
MRGTFTSFVPGTLASVLAFGCSSSPSDDGPLQVEGPSAVVVLTRACTPDACSHYLSAVDQLPADGVLDRRQALEFGDVQGSVHGDAVYIFDFTDQTVQRFRLNPSSELEAGPILSFQGLGLGFVAGILNAWGAPDRAFLLDPSSGQVVTWDPIEMIIVATTPIPEEFLERDGFRADFTWPAVIDDRVYYNAYWFDFEGYAGSTRAGTLSFDARSDQPELTLLEEERCGGSSSSAPFASPDGRVHVVGDGVGGLFTVVGAGSGGACALRVALSGTGFDPGYALDLIGGDALALSGAWSLDGGAALLANVWMPSTPPALPLDVEQYWSSSEFGWLIIDTETGETRRVDGIPLAGAGNLTPLSLDGVRHVQIYPPGREGVDPEASLYAVQPDGSAQLVLRGGPAGDFEMIGRISVPVE